MLCDKASQLSDLEEITREKMMNDEVLPVFPRVKKEHISEFLTKRYLDFLMKISLERGVENLSLSGL